jgi:hypothetical protein
MVPGQNWQNAALSESLFRVLREPLKVVVPDDRVYEGAFDRFEYLRTLVYVDLTRELQQQSGRSNVWGPSGRFKVTYYANPERRVSKLIEREAAEAQKTPEGWALLKAGLFGGSSERFATARDLYSRCHQM